MIWLVGAGGMLGSEVARRLQKLDLLHRATDLDVDVTSEGAAREHALALRPRWILNCAAYTAVDRAESEASQAFAVNAAGAEHLALAATDVGATLVHVSTDYVFDGSNPKPYDEDAATNPIGVYGRSKEEGERRIREACPQHIIVRTAWLHGPYGPNFVATMLRLMGEHPELRVVEDQHGSPTYASDLARLLVRITQEALATGTYHFTNTGTCTWHEFAQAIQAQALELGLLQSPVPIRGIPAEAYPTPARRPANSVLATDRIRAALGLTIPTWQDGLRRHLERILRAEQTA